MKQPVAVCNKLEVALNVMYFVILEVEAISSSWSQTLIGVKTWCIWLYKKLRQPVEVGHTLKWYSNVMYLAILEVEATSSSWSHT